MFYNILSKNVRICNFACGKGTLMLSQIMRQEEKNGLKKDAELHSGASFLHINTASRQHHRLSFAVSRKARGNQPHQNNDSQMLTTLLAVQIILVQNNTKRTRK